ncbi:uncharacterized protein [Solanum lycopersicum]|uniref:uncharacterized protein n=1 Tax=Solanum lycopersicum TaxID=4081 RepID=UPI00374913C4
MTKSSRILAVKTIDSVEDYSKPYINDIVRIHGVPFSTISDRDGWTSRAYYSDPGGMLRACVINFKGSWDDHLPLIEFAYNNSYHSSIQKVQLIIDRIKTAQSHQISYANVRRRELEFQVDDWVLLKFSTMKKVMRFGKKRMVIPRYLIPYKIIKRVGKVEYELELLAELASVYPVRRSTNKEVTSLKLLGRYQSVEGATQEAEAVMKAKYHHLFPVDSTPA